MYNTTLSAIEKTQDITETQVILVFYAPIFLWCDAEQHSLHDDKKNNKKTAGKKTKVYSHVVLTC